MSRTKIVAAGVVVLAVAGGAGAVALWDDMPWADQERTCATRSASVRTEIAVPVESGSLPPRPVLSPDGRLLLHPIDEPVLVDAGTGRTVRSYNGGIPRVLSFRADGSSFVAQQQFRNELGGADGIVLWSVTSAKALQTIPHDIDHGLVRDVAVSPDGRLIAVSSGDKSVRLWDARTGRLTATLTDTETKGLSEFQTSSLTFSPDGKRLALADTEGTVTVWQTGRSPELEREFSAPGSGGLEATFSPDGRYLAIRQRGASRPAHDQNVWVVELATGRGVTVAHHLNEQVRAMRFSPDSGSIVTITLGGLVERTTLADGTATPLLEICGVTHMMVGVDATTAVTLEPSADGSVFEIATYALP